MDIKDLNKSQLILLAILLSFVVSIATGITTVTLMEQAPSSVTVPINRIVRQTVEKIEQVEGKTTTVIVKEEDLVVDAISKNQEGTFVITKETYSRDENEMIEIPAGKGFAVSKDGIIAADAQVVTQGGKYFIKNSSGKFKTEFLVATDSGIAFLKAGEPVTEGEKLSYEVPAFGDVKNMKVGQKIIVYGPSINSFIYDGDSDIKISTNKSNAGGIVLNLDGEVLGMVISSDTVSFIPINTVTEALKIVAPPA